MSSTDFVQNADMTDRPLGGDERGWQALRYFSLYRIAISGLFALLVSCQAASLLARYILIPNQRAGGRERRKPVSWQGIWKKPLAQAISGENQL